MGQPLWWLQLLSLFAFCLVLSKCGSAKESALAGWMFGTVSLSATFWWLFIALHTYGGLPAWLSAIAVAALAAALSLYYAAACAAYFHLYQRNFWARAGAVFAALWTMAELARGTWFTGFGWGSGGYAHIDGPLVYLAPWIGVYGIGMLSAWAAMTTASGVRQRQWGRALAVPTLLVAALAAPWNAKDWTGDAGSIPVRLLQGNIPQDEKFESGTGVPDALRWYGETLTANFAGLVVAPETALPLLPQQLPSGYWKSLQAHFSQAERAALIGIPLGNFSRGYTNSVVGLHSASTEVWRYDKHHLVPFGEFIPPLFKWFTDLMHIPLGDFNRGELGQPSFAAQGQRLAPNICYEDLFGEELASRFTDETLAPTVFVNVSNLGWFGNSVAIDQHLNISRMRALEFQRPFIRATNTGSTAILDYRGKVAAALPRFTRGVLDGTVQGRQGITPYAYWAARWGLWPLWLFAGLICGLAWRSARRRRAIVDDAS
jgi:apolipoprotein N-acyltransferase